MIKRINILQSVQISKGVGFIFPLSSVIFLNLPDTPYIDIIISNSLFIDYKINQYGDLVSLINKNCQM